MLGVETVVLHDGTVIIADPDYDLGDIPDVGSITVYSDFDSFILHGTSANDRLGSGGITAVGTYGGWAVHSPLWDNGPAVDAGAVTTSGVRSPDAPFERPLSAENSLVGTHANDQLGSGGVMANTYGMLVVLSPKWDNGPLEDAGAVTCADVMIDPLRFRGEASPENSAVGSTAGDQLGSGGAILLMDEYQYIIHSPLWDNGAAVDAGAIFASSRGNAGPLSASNALVGSSTGDRIGSGGIIRLAYSWFVVSSPLWDNGVVMDAGAVTKGTDTRGTPVTGIVSAENSLVGTTAGDRVGSGGVAALRSEQSADFVVSSPFWNNGTVPNAGAVTLDDDFNIAIGAVTPANSLVGTSANDQIGGGGVTVLGSKDWTSGEMVCVVCSPQWDNGGSVDVGAFTHQLISLTSNKFVVGPVSPANSLVGSSQGDQIGSGGVVNRGSSSSRTEGYAIISPLWDNDAKEDAGAVTILEAWRRPVGIVSPSNSLVGASAGDQVGSGGVVVVRGHFAFAVHSPLWDHDVAVDAGAVTFARQDNRPAGLISAANSLVGSHPNDHVGSVPVIRLQSPVTVYSPDWCYGAGALTTISPEAWEVAAVVSGANSDVGPETALPEIAVFQPSTIEVGAGDLRDFGGVETGQTGSLTFVIKNTGTDDLLLSGLPQVATSGSDASLFTIASRPPALIVTGGSATFTVHFMPTTSGIKMAALTIPNNDEDESAFQVLLKGMATQPPISSWRQTHFGSNANTGVGADDADFDHDGIPNLVEYALGLHPVQNTTSQLPLPVKDSTAFGLSFTEPPGISGLSYGAEWSTSLSSGSWQPVIDSGTPPQHVFSVPVGGNTKIFMRLKVTPAP